MSGENQAKDGDQTWFQNKIQCDGMGMSLF